MASRKGGDPRELSQGFIAALSLVFAGLGLYGVLTHSVSRQAREIGIRMALGARGRNVLRLVIRHGMTLTMGGLGIGLVGSLAAKRVLTKLLPGLTFSEPLIFGQTVVLFVTVSLLACYLPARRAIRVDPAVTLRNE